MTDTYIVFELQTNKDGIAAILTNKDLSFNQAESTYHSILAAAALSNVYSHSAVMIRSTGQFVKSDGYFHEDPEEKEEG